MNVVTASFFSSLLVAPILAYAANYLSPNGVLQRTQYIETTSKNYKLIMQDDGSLVMYRSDGTKRYGMAKGGQFAVMQSDGNFVEYSPFAQAIWSSGTAGNPNAYLHIQDDGNLVVYSQNSTPLWNIGAEPSPNDPSLIADVVGRDLEVAGFGWLGHVGIWDGEKVVEAVYGEYNAVRLSTINQFKTETSYWGKATWKLPDELQRASCYNSYCYSGTYFPKLNARLAAAQRARQVYLIGAEYTTTTYVTLAEYADDNRPLKRGKYRCDTFVLWSLFPNYESPASTAAQTWIQRWNSMYSNSITPSILMNSLRSFQ